MRNSNANIIYIESGEFKSVNMGELRKNAMSGNAESQYLYGKQLLDLGSKEDALEAVKWIKKSAEQNNDEAQLMLGMMYFDGNYVNVNISKAISLFEKSSNQGNNKAQFLLAGAYLNGYGVKKNYQKAFELTKKAAKNGNIYAKQVLDVCFNNSCN